MLRSLFDPGFWEAYVLRAARSLLLAIPVAALFEVANVIVRRWALKRLAPALTRDSDREPTVRARRRRALRDVTISGTRWVVNIIAVTVILTIWNVDPLAVAILVLTTAGVLYGVLRDGIAGYELLLDDCLAPGDWVRINGELVGIVAEVRLRRLRLADEAGHTWWVRSSDVRTIENLSQPAPAGPDEAAT